MIVLLSILTFVAYVMVCMLMYLLIDVTKEIFEKLPLRARNIIIRILVVLGPIVIIPFIVIFTIVYVLIPIIKDFWKWLIDIDSKTF